MSIGRGYSGTTCTSCYMVNNLMISNTGINDLGNGTTFYRNKSIGGSIIPANNDGFSSATPVTFIGASDFHLASTDTGAKSLGTNWPSSYFTYDKDGNARTNWSLGAYDYRYGGTTNAALVPPLKFIILPQ